MSHREAYPAIVVGTGFGGSVVACRLAQAGVQTLVLERGRRYEADDFPALPAEGALLPENRRWTWEGSQGLWEIVDLDEVVTFQAAGYGGGSLIYANVHLRPPESSFGKEWPDVYQGRENLEKYFDLVASMLDVAPMDKGSPLDHGLVKTEQFERAASSLGRKHFRPPLAVAQETHTNHHGVKQGACTGCGRCCSGCPDRAKSTLDLNYLAVAEKHAHVTMKTQHEVLDFERVSPDPSAKGGAQSVRWAVHCMDHLSAKRVTFLSETLFLCAGSIHSTRLLARYRDASKRHGGPERVPNAGIGYFPGAGAIGVAYGTRNPQHPSSGPMITTSIAQKDESGKFFMIQDAGYPPELARMFGALKAPLWLGRNRVDTSADGVVLPSNKTPLSQPAHLTKRHLTPPLPSPLDGVLDALARGDLGATDLHRSIVPAQIEHGVQQILDELGGAVLLPDVVAETINRITLRGLPGILVLPFRMLDRLYLPLRPGSGRGPLTRAALWVLRLVAYAIYLKGPRGIARDALAGALTASALTRHEWTSRLLSYDEKGTEHRHVFLAMGRDLVPGLLLHDQETGRMHADLDLYHLAPRYSQEERLMADLAGKLGGELRTSPAWAFLGKPFATHNQGGCPMGDHPECSVVDANGEVWSEPGLYVLDGSILSRSVGVNPSATIAAIAERCIDEFLKTRPGQKWPTPEYEAQRGRAKEWRTRADKLKWAIEPILESVDIQTPPLALEFKERMEGFYKPDPPNWPAGGWPCSAPLDRDAAYRRLEAAGRPKPGSTDGYPIAVHLKARAPDLSVFFEDETHALNLEGKLTGRLPDQESAEYEVEGTLQLFVPRYKEKAVPEDSPLRAAQRCIGGRAALPISAVTSQVAKTERLMTYSLTFVAPLSRSDPTKGPWMLRGYKRIREDPGLDAWRDVSALFTSLYDPHGAFRGAGVIHVDLPGLLYDQLPSFTVGHIDRNDVLVPTEDAAQAAWAIGKFAAFFFGSLQRIYMPGAPRALEALFRPRSNNVIY